MFVYIFKVIIKQTNKFLDKNVNKMLSFYGAFGKYYYFYSEYIYWDLAEYFEIKAQFVGVTCGQKQGFKKISWGKVIDLKVDVKMEVIEQNYEVGLCFQ